ncbi:hypothetical protein LA304_04635 [Celeribacter sp. ASW11-22]|nr:hypothetical protein [Celeribacter litoreus]
MTYELSIQDMIDRVSETPLSVAEITEGFKSGDEAPFKYGHWEVVRDVCEGISANIWESLTTKQQIDRLCEVIELWPCYATSHHLFQFYVESAQADPVATEHLWGRIVGYLERFGTPQCDALEYVLWVDFFEDQSTCEAAWHGLMCMASDRKVRDRILINAGPVPYVLKKPIYHQMIKFPDEHEALAESLAHSKQDYFGDIDRKDARKLVKRLDLPRSDEFVAYLKDNL